VSESLNTLLVAVLAAEIALILFLLNKKPKFKKFAGSMTFLMMIMTPVGLTFPVIIENKFGFYLFPLIYLGGIISWLFIVRKYIIGVKNWFKESDTKKAIRKTFLLLMSGFFIMTIILVLIAPSIPHW